jgi:hypothetical protein
MVSAEDAAAQFEDNDNTPFGHAEELPSDAIPKQVIISWPEDDPENPYNWTSV